VLCLCQLAKMVHQQVLPSSSEYADGLSSECATASVFLSSQSVHVCVTLPQNAAADEDDDDDDDEDC